jgi:glucose-1-phosphate thymidylyltransferase
MTAKLRKGVVLAGGNGSRLLPLTHSLNKHLLAIAEHPMILHAVGQLLSAGIEEMMVVTGAAHLGHVRSRLEHEPTLRGRLRYQPQSRPAGIAHALATAELFAAGENIAVILGDNLFGAPLGPVVDRFRNQAGGCRLVLTRAIEPERYGVARFADSGRATLLEIIEKPEVPPSDLVVTGIYLYDGRVFELIRALSPSNRGELEITDLNNRYLELGLVVHELWPHPWIDAGTHASLALANAAAAHWGWPPTGPTVT